MNTYLYELEDKLYLPGIDYSKTNFPVLTINRLTFVDWMYTIVDHLKLDIICFGLAVTLMDIYFSLLYEKYPDGNKYNWQGIALTCIHIADSLLSVYPKSNLEYSKLSGNRIQYNDLLEIRNNIISQLDGILIRSSQIFFLEDDFVILSYFSSELITYKPSDIIDAIINLTSENQEESGPECKALIDILNNLPISKVKENIKSLAIKVGEQIKNKCLVTVREHGEKTSPMKNIVDEDYEVIKSLGNGAFSEVYQVKKNDKYFAMKRYIVPDRLEIMNEIACLRLLKGSEYIVSFEGFYIQDTEMFLFYEYGSFNLTTGVTILGTETIPTNFLSILRGINLCHSNDLIHGDIKPDNIVWFGDNFKLIDFGSSLPYASKRTQLWEGLTSPYYRAPEIYLEEFYNYKVDIWSAGLVLYFMVTKGLRLFNGDGVLDQILDTSKWYEHETILGNYFDIISKILIISPDDRPSSEELIRFFHSIF